MRKIACITPAPFSCFKFVLHFFQQRNASTQRCLERARRRVQVSRSSPRQHLFRNQVRLSAPRPLSRTIFLNPLLYCSDGRTPLDWAEYTQKPDVCVFLRSLST